jgi:tRNA-specific 2-thiouridylase
MKCQDATDFLADYVGGTLTDRMRVDGAYRPIAISEGLGIATGSPLYVIQIKGNSGQVVVGSSEELYTRTLRAHRFNLIAVSEVPAPIRVTVKIRHRHEGAPASLEKVNEEELLVTFDEPQRAVTPGQAAVFYDGEVVIGGGWIV